MASEFLGENIELQEPSKQYSPTALARIIGASFGAFVFCFLSILISLPFNKGAADQDIATLFWIICSLVGGVVGFAYPRVSHLLAFLFLLFLTAMLSITIGRNIGEQIALFAGFSLAELVFVWGREIIRKSEKVRGNPSESSGMD